MTERGAASIDYIIDGQNRRIGKKVNGVLVEGFLYRDQLQPVVWLNGNGSVRATFVYGLRPNVPEYMVQGGTTYRLITDQVGSVRLVVNTSTGAVAERIDYDEFGNVLSDTAPGTQPFGFAGGVKDAEAGLTRFGARDYDPVGGRWTAKDPVQFAAGAANLYEYVGSDPIEWMDPEGSSRFPLPSPVPFLPSSSPPGQIGGAAGDFWRYYWDMRESNWRNQDKYFHCMANCSAASRGVFGRGTAWGIGWGREIADFSRPDKKDSWLSCRADLDANAFGRRGPNPACSDRCDPLRPPGMPPIR